MTEYDRGPYTPPGERLAFDPREPVRSSGPAPVTLIVSALVLVGLVGGVAYLYRHGVRHAGAGPAVVGTTLGPVKTAAPPPPSANQVAGLVIDRSEPAGAPPAFAPPPEQPAPRQTAAAPTTEPQVQPAAAPTTTTEGPPPPPPPPVAAKPAAAKPAAPMTIASLTDAAISQKPPAKPKVAAPPAPPKPAQAAPAAAPGSNLVQIGAFSSAALADKGWSDVARLQPAAIKGKGRKVEAVARDGATLYRAYVTGFPTHAAAETFCADLKAAGRSCIVK